MKDAYYVVKDKERLEDYGFEIDRDEEFPEYEIYMQGFTLNVRDISFFGEYPILEINSYGGCSVDAGLPDIIELINRMLEDGVIAREEFE